MRGNLSRDDLPMWRWSELITDDFFIDLPPDFSWDLVPEELKAEESKAAEPEKKQSMFRFVPIKTQHCVDKDLAFCESLAIAYSRVLEERGEKVFLRGNSFTAKLAKAIFENDKNLFITSCEKKDNKEEYFKECSQALEEHGFVIENKTPNKDSWGSIFDKTRLLTEEYLATKLEGGLPVIKVSELKENSENESKFDIIVTPESAKDEDIKEAALAILQRDGLEDSSDKVKAGELFYKFLSNNSPFKEALPRPKFKIDTTETRLGFYKQDTETIHINQRLVLDSLRDENHRDRFALLLIMLREYGSFLSEHPDSKLYEKRVGRTFARRFMKNSIADLFNKDFEFADFTTLDSKDKEQKFTVKISNLSYKERKDIYLYLMCGKYVIKDDFRELNYKDKKECESLHEKSKLKVNKGNHLWNTLLDYHYGEMI
ncbi:MAG: hypothetical protein LBU89_07655, partial [Fibromonadaceae bacterium]|nr:hypothetical protein [Fibromonadaceae bacterium]